MTPEERTMAVAAKWHSQGGGVLEDLIAAAIREAVAEEREWFVGFLGRTADQIEKVAATDSARLAGDRESTEWQVREAGAAGAVAILRHLAGTLQNYSSSNDATTGTPPTSI